MNRKQHKRDQGSSRTVIRNLAVIVPAFNAEKTIKSLIDELLRFGFDQKHILIINDGSRDRTADILEETGVQVITHSHNRGKGAALQSGFNTARCQGFTDVVMLDADGQHQVADIKQFLPNREDFDLIIGIRSYDISMPLVRRIVNRVTSLVMSVLSSSYIPDVQSGFRFMRLKIMDRIDLRTDNYQTESELVYKVLRRGYRIGFVPVAVQYNDQRSYIRPLRDTIRFIDMALRCLWR